jgi:hypothetical protein
MTGRPPYSEVFLAPSLPVPTVCAYTHDQDLVRDSLDVFRSECRHADVRITVATNGVKYLKLTLPN